MAVRQTRLTELVRDAAERGGAGRRGALAVGAVLGDATAWHGVRGAGSETLFEIGSLSKTFTSLALATLASEDVVGAEQPLRELLPDGARLPERGGRQIRLIQLATHTSGLPRLPKGMFPRALFPAADPYAACTPDALLAGLARTRLRSDPGERFHYSNLGAGILGLALADHTGRDYEALVQEEICAPLGLTDTRVELDAERAARLAQGHSRRGRPVPRWHLAGLAAAGGLHSTVADLLVFLRAQLGDGPPRLGPALRMTHEGGHWVNERVQIHLGWTGLRQPKRAGGERALFHNGGTGGYRCWMGIAPDHRAAAVVLSAQARGVDRCGFALLHRLTAGEGAQVGA